MSRRLQSRRGAVATVVVDGNTLNIVHVYVQCTLRPAMHAFMADLRHGLDPAYSDTRAQLEDALQRYQFIETHDVTIGRG